MSEITPSVPGGSPFDRIRRVRPDGSEYWSAREMQPLQGYSKWQHFLIAIERAKAACFNSGERVEDHFTDARNNPSDLGGRPSMDVHLTRYAAYLVAMNGDPRKTEIAAAQTYFAVKAREAEVRQPQVQITATDIRAEQIISALAELACREHIVPFAGRTLAFHRWRKPHKVVEGFVQLTINMNLPDLDGGAAAQLPKGGE